MEPGRHFDQIMDWNEKLRLLAHLQSEYRGLLAEQGFDDEQAFTLVRDWSHRVWDWTTRSAFEDPTTAGFGEPYLLPPQQADAAAESEDANDEPSDDRERTERGERSERADKSDEVRDIRGGTWWFGDNVDEAA